MLSKSTKMASFKKRWTARSFRQNSFNFKNFNTGSSSFGLRQFGDVKILFFSCISLGGDMLEAVDSHYSCLVVYSCVSGVLLAPLSSLGGMRLCSLWPPESFNNHPELWPWDLCQCSKLVHSSWCFEDKPPPCPPSPNIKCFQGAALIDRNYPSSMCQCVVVFCWDMFPRTHSWSRLSAPWLIHRSHTSLSRASTHCSDWIICTSLFARRRWTNRKRGRLQRQEKKRAAVYVCMCLCVERER